MTLGVCHLLLESNFPGKSVEPPSESRRPGITARREGLTRKIDVDELSVEDASPGSILNDKHQELWSY